VPDSIVLWFSESSAFSLKAPRKQQKLEVAFLVWPVMLTFRHPA
jgi:hypothetical protein